MNGSASYEDKVVGCFLGALCGDALGASVENWTSSRIQKCHKKGLTAFQDTDRGFGCYTDDGQMLLALAASLVNKRHCCAADAAHQYALAFDPERGYGGSAVKILMRLAAGADPTTTATQFLPGGSFGNGGAMRIAPLGLAYRNASLDALIRAVSAALLCTHVHPLAIDGALAQALAVAELSKMQHVPTAAAAAAATGAGAQPQPLQLLQLLRSQLSGCGAVEMCDKLLVLEQALQQVPATPPTCQPWSKYFASQAWAHELATAEAVAPGFQIKATDAVAAALWAAMRHWDCPADAVVAAVHYGGDTDTIACMTGALMGALHGSAWLPNHWVENLENKQQPSSCFKTPDVNELLAACVAAPADGELVITTRDMGRDGAIVLAKMLAQLDCKE